MFDLPVRADRQTGRPVNRTFTFRAHTNPEGWRRLYRVAWLAARLYNHELACRKWLHAMLLWNPGYEGPRFDYNAMAKRLTALRARDPDYEALAVGLLRGVLKKQDRAVRARKGKYERGQYGGRMRFKSARRWRTFEVADPRPHMVKLRGKTPWLKVKGLPDLELRGHRELPDAPLKNILISLRGRRIEVNVVYDIGDAPAVREPRTVIGVDLGVIDSVALSDGTLTGRNDPRAGVDVVAQRGRRGMRRQDKRRQRRYAIERKQRRLSACGKGSANRKRRVKALANAYGRRRVRDRNRCHRISTMIVRKADMIAFEGLRIGAMTASAAGTVESPGTNVAAKSALNRSILEQNLGRIRAQSTYKAESAGGSVVTVDPVFTSQTCSHCGVIESSARRGKAYHCAECGVVDDADVNAAVNVGLRGCELAGVGKARLLRAGALPP